METLFFFETMFEQLNLYFITLHNINRKTEACNDVAVFIMISIENKLIGSEAIENNEKMTVSLSVKYYFPSCFYCPPMSNCENL